MQRRRQLSWAFNKHMPSAHHPQSKRCGHLRTKRGLPSTRFQMLEKCGVFWRRGKGISLSQGLGRGQCRAAPGSWPISGYLSSSFSWPLAPRLPRSVLGGGGLWCRPFCALLRPGLQAMLPAWAPPLPPSFAGSSPGRRAGSPRVHLARVPAAACSAASSAMLRLG